MFWLKFLKSEVVYARISVATYQKGKILGP